MGTEVELDGAPLRVTRVEEGTASGFWLRAAGVPRPNPDEIVTARNIEIVAESGEPEAAESEGDAPAAEPDKSDGGDKGAGGGGDRKRRRRGKTLVGR